MQVCVFSFMLTITGFLNKLLVTRVGQLLSLLLEYQEVTLKEAKFQDDQVYQDEKTRSDFFTFLCNKMEKHLKSLWK